MIIGMGFFTHPDYAALQDKAVADVISRPSYEQRLKENALIRNLDSKDNVWASRNVFYCFRNDTGDENYSFYNWKDPSSFEIVKTGAVDYSNMSGSKGGGGDYNTGWDPSVNGDGKYVEGNASFMYDLLENSTGVHFGASGGSGSGYSYISSASMIGRINNSTFNPVPNDPGPGFWIYTRPDGSTLDMYKDGVLDETHSIVTDDLTSQPFRIFCRTDFGGTAQNHSAAKIGIISFGAHITNPTGVYESLQIFKSGDVDPGFVMDPDDEIGVNVTADGKQIFATCGDSMAAGNASPGTGLPTPGANQVFEWNGTAFVACTDSDMIGSNGGSWGVQFGMTFNDDTGKVAHIVNKALGGSEYYPAGDDNNWSNTGDLYLEFKTELDQALANLGLTKPKAIIKILGVNDARNANTLSDIQAAAIELMDNLTTDYPGVPILMYTIGWEGTNPTNNPTSITNSRFAYIRDFQTRFAWDYTDIHVMTLAGYAGAGYHRSGDVHFSDAGNIVFGNMVARWLRNYAYPKLSRAIISSYFDDLSSHRKSLIDNSITNIGTTDWQKVEAVQIYKTTLEINVFQDWRMKTAPCDIGFGFTANSFITCSSTSAYIHPTVTNLLFSATQDNTFMGVKIVTNRTAAGTAATLMGFRNSGATIITEIEQIASSVLQYRLNSQTADSYATDTKLQNDTFYGMLRTGSTTISLIKNNAIVDSDVDTSTGNGSNVDIGVRNNNGAKQQAIDADIEYFIRAAGDVDYENIIDQLEIVVDEWNN